MSFLKSFEQKDKQKKLNKKIDSELPFFITIVTLLSTSGFGPYSIFIKIKDMELLPHVRKEAMKILKKIDILGMDPLTVMTEVKDRGPSNFGEFLSGYVSAIQSGGDVVNYLKTKMTSAFDLYENAQKGLVDQVKALVDTYLTMQIVILAVYIIVTATTTGGITGAPPLETDIDPIYFVILMPPIISGLFLFLAKSINKSKIDEIDLKKIIMFGIPGIIAATAIIFLKIIPDYNLYILGGALIVSAVWPAIKFQSRYQFSLDAESAAAIILRDVAEARKAGLGPEKCVIRATKRKDYGLFNKVANGISNKLEWGMTLENIFQFIKKETTDFQILINFRVLFEIISSGGGNVNTLDTLASISEKIRNIEKSKRDMLKPYVLVGFMLVGITSFTTLLVIDSLTGIGTGLEADEVKKNTLQMESNARFELLGIAILVQAWLSGLFLGKITTGSYSAGFRHSIILIIISMISIAVIQSKIFSVGTIFG
ncbi:type II secretion system F family protein [Nitrosarchaeum koreense]|uniref:Type II secretion system protein n=1 Tax=Nitrosarchaeum koreense MY1 TaxID=1001994 RepID=F9CWT8_9ARCH|nr:type II secretion system F family protein [Nitrosarchaeum koreense]EGP93740.1 Type II secretion system protein [Nitrosarchaeum koreense MY1]